MRSPMPGFLQSKGPISSPSAGWAGLGGDSGKEGGEEEGVEMHGGSGRGTQEALQVEKAIMGMFFMSERRS